MCTPRVAIITAIKEQSNHRNNWRTNRTRALVETGDGEGKYSLEKIQELAAEGRCPPASRQGTCQPWIPEDRWGMPDEHSYTDSIAVELVRYITGNVDAIEMAGRWQ